MLKRYRTSFFLDSLWVIAYDSWSMKLWRSIKDRPFDQIHILVPIEPHIFVCAEIPPDTKFKLILVLTRPFTKNTNVFMKFWWEILFINAVAIPVMSGKTLLYMIIGFWVLNNWRFKSHWLIFERHSSWIQTH